MAGELHDNAEAKVFTPAGAESARLVVSNGDMAAFQGVQQRGGVSVAEREQAMFGNGFDFNQTGNVYGGQRRDLLAWRPGQQLEPVKPQPEGPPIGERVSVENLLGLVSPIGPASQKSETLKSLLGDMRKHPWEVGLVFEPNPKNPEYDPNEKENTIHVDSIFSKQKQIETFGHELYHATHQNLDDLYGDKDPVSLDRYKQIKMDQEAGAFLTEFKINRELHHSEKPAYSYVENNQIKPKHIEDFIFYKQLGVIDEVRSKESIAKFLSEHPAPVYENGHEKRNLLAQIETQSYSQKNESDYWKSYRPNFETNHRNLAERGWLGKGF
jgi:hypothetical protein